MAVSGSRVYLSRRAFSLLELVVAVGILGIGITALVQAIAFCGRAAGFSGDITRAVFIAEDLLQQLEYKENQAKLSSEPKEKEEKIDKFTYKYALITDDLLKTLYRANFSIRWQRPEREESFNLDTYLRQ